MLRKHGFSNAADQRVGVIGTGASVVAVGMPVATEPPNRSYLSDSGP